MQSTDDRRDGVLVIGAWIDAETAEFRARIMRTGPSGDTEYEVSYADSPDLVTEIVGDWLREFRD